MFSNGNVTFLESPARRKQTSPQTRNAAIDPHGTRVRARRVANEIYPVR